MLQSVRKYWDSLRADRTAPCRSELEQKQFSAALENVFILERVSALDVRIRLCGAKINQALDRECRGLAFEMIFHPNSHNRLAEILTEVFDVPCTAELRLASLKNGHEASRLDMILLPLSSESGEMSRAIGCLQPEVAHQSNLGTYTIVRGTTQPIQILATQDAPGLREEAVDFERLLWPTLVSSQSGEPEKPSRTSLARRPNLKLISDN